MIKHTNKTLFLACSIIMFSQILPTYAEQKAPTNAIASGATPPTLKIDGNSSVNAYFMKQKQRANGKGGPQPHLDNGVSNIYLSVLGASSNGLEYMFRITLATTTGTSSVIDQNYLQFKGNFGTVQMGNIVGPEDSMPRDAGVIIGGTGGFDGAYSNVYNMSAGVIRGNDNIGDTGNATKIVYYSPELQGWQVGIAYTPNTSHVGSNNLDVTTPSGIDKIPGNRGLYDNFATKSKPYDLRNVAIGLTYRKEIGKWSITLSGAGITAKSYFYDSSVGRVSFQDVKAYQLGFLMAYLDWRFGAGFLDNGKSHLPRAANFTYGPANAPINLGAMNNGNAGRAWNVGAGYIMGAYQFGVSYQGTNRNTGNSLRAKSDFFSATVDVTPLQGLKVYFEADYISSRTNSTVVQRESATITAPKTAMGNNSAVLGIIGTKISF